MPQKMSPPPGHTPDVHIPLTSTQLTELDRRSRPIVYYTADGVYSIQPTTPFCPSSSCPHPLKAEALRLHFRRTVTGLLKKRTSERMHSHDQWGISAEGGFLC
ncbi:MAG: hypothetical protein JNL29_11430 [Nitrospira sp.]|nr:hypothetical protein [Nitrospira sp.]